MRNITYIILLLAAQCTSPNPKTQSVKKYFDIATFTNQLINTQANAAQAIKMITEVKGVKEEKEITNADSSFWANELTPLVIADINRPSLLDAFNVEENKPEENSNLLSTIYTALPNTHSNVKKVEIKYLHNIDEIRQISAVLETQNPVYSTHQKINVWLNSHNGQPQIDSILTIGVNKTIFLDSLTYSSLIITH